MRPSLCGITTCFRVIIIRLTLLLFMLDKSGWNQKATAKESRHSSVTVASDQSDCCSGWDVTRSTNSGWGKSSSINSLTSRGWAKKKESKFIENGITIYLFYVFYIFLFHSWFISVIGKSPYSI